MTDKQIQALIQLKDLKEQGILSQEEFEKEKAEILQASSAPQQQPETSVKEEPVFRPVTTNPEKVEAEPPKPVTPKVSPNVTPKKKKSWIEENWWIIAGTLVLALAKIVSRL